MRTLLLATLIVMMSMASCVNTPSGADDSLGTLTEGNEIVDNVIEILSSEESFGMDFTIEADASEGCFTELPIDRDVYCIAVCQ